jgi:putative PIN family toxin of toxin-antitoxin system
MNHAERVVFDCNVFFQALISPSGPAGLALDAVVDGKCELFISDFIFEEIKAVTSRPQLAARFRLAPERIDLYIEFITGIATTLAEVPAKFSFPRDPMDAHYVDLAIAAQAKLIVSRDKDLLSLADDASPEGQSFKQQFPDIEILTPTELMRFLSSI